MLNKVCLKLIVACLLTVGLLLGTFPSLAAEDNSNLDETDILNIELPVVNEQNASLFDFFLDPQGLLYQTGAEQYGGGFVEEGATLLFRNREGQYDFSCSSDKLIIRNMGDNPITVTISVSVTGLSEISLREGMEFEKNERSFYIAIKDNHGNEVPINANGEAVLSFILGESDETINIEEYSFQLTGFCNPDANWKGISDAPIITVIWSVEPADPKFDESVISTEEQETDIVLTENSDSAQEPEVSDENAAQIVIDSEALDRKEIIKETETDPSADTIKEITSITTDETKEANQTEEPIMEKSEIE